MSKFGWSYPAGAANDPNAPYNQEEILDNSFLEKAFEDYEGLFDIYHSIYKYGSCGHTIGFTLYGVFVEDNGESGPAGYGGIEENKTFYCDDLRQFGIWKDLREYGFYVSEISVSSIVEGVDQCAETIWVDCDPLTFEPGDIRKAFDKACADVEKEVDQIWNETHGCDECREHWNSAESNCYGYNEYDLCPVWKDCPECNGDGAII
ncbi:MAG: hypothetical protein ACR2PH_07745 [Desulfobulbia bacterium]